VDSELVGMTIRAAGGALVFGASVFGVFIDHTVGQYGSVPAAAVVSGVGFAALLAAALGFRNRISWIDPSLAQAAGIGCCVAGMMLMNPLPGTPLPFGQVVLVGVVGSVLGSSLIIFGAIDRDAFGTA